MPRYFFNILRGEEVVPDLEGSEFPDLEAARREAVAGARAILSEEVLSGSLSLDERIEVVDESGAVLLSLPFMSAIEIHARYRDRRGGTDE